MDFLKKLQTQPLHTKKLILWIMVAIIGFLLLSWWIQNSYQRIKRFQPEESFEGLNLSPIEEELKELPAMEASEPSE